MDTLAATGTSDWDGGNSFLISLSGCIMGTLLNLETCMYCITYLKEWKDGVTCSSIENKQRGGLIKPIVDNVAIVQLCKLQFTAFDHASETLTNDLLSKILIEQPILLEALDHNNLHKIKIMEKVVSNFICAEGKHECRPENVESACSTRKKKKNHSI